MRGNDLNQGTDRSYLSYLSKSLADWLYLKISLSEVTLACEEVSFSKAHNMSLPIEYFSVQELVRDSENVDLNDTLTHTNFCHHLSPKFFLSPPPV